jgi:hypothetical protein
MVTQFNKESEAFSIRVEPLENGKHGLEDGLEFDLAQNYK